MNLGITLLCAAFGAALAGCASIPVGPSVRVMPAPGKPFDLFNEDNVICKEYARQQLGVDPNKVAEEKVLSGAAAGAAIGAVSGALIGGRGSAQGGAGAGVLLGSAVGADAANRTTMTLQRRYDIAYEQCMYAKGNQVPGYPAPLYTTVPPPPPAASPVPPPPRS